MATGNALKGSTRTEFGDWQTPLDLAMKVCRHVAEHITPKSVFEPNCGEGAFLKSSIQVFSEAESFLGLEINPQYAEEAAKINSSRLKIIKGDFFTDDWQEKIRKLAQPLLVIGNPPWVTNSELAKLRSENLPVKKNFQRFNGIEAITGKSNFDISEWMLIREIEALQGKNAVLAMLCKTTIARKTVLYAWKNKYKFNYAAIRRIDAKKHFSVAVDACLLVIQFMPGSDKTYCSCSVFSSLHDIKPSYVLGLRNGRLVSNVEVVDTYKDCISTTSSEFVWRSGIKHDSAKVMELRIDDGGKIWNGYDDLVDIETNLMYPMLKSSDLANGKIKPIKRFMLVPQKLVGSDTSSLKHAYPKTWNYLMSYSSVLDKRRSSIYKKRPRFTIFGVGEYTYALWKIAISGLYKSIRFRVIGSEGNKPIVFDDTCYFMPCESEAEAEIILRILQTQTANDILSAHIFWDSKRPITRDILSLLSISKIAEKNGMLHELKASSSKLSYSTQQTLF